MFSLIPWGNKSKGVVARTVEARLLPADVFEPFNRIRAELDRAFGGFFGGLPAAWDGGWGLGLEDRADAYVVHAEVPGFEPADFDLEVQDNRLVLRAEKKAESKDEQGHSFRRQSYERVVTLPAGFDREKIEAAYKNGVLTVTLPKTEVARPKKIAIQG
jgi:HSP20 family protein